MPNQLVPSLAALGVALAPAFLKFAEAPRSADLDADEDAETQCISGDDAPVHPRFQSSATQARLREGSVVQIVSKRKNWRHIAYVEGEEASLGWITKSYLEPCEASDDPDRDGGHAPGVCADDLDSCPVNGCANDGAPHGIFNERKRSTVDSHGSVITFDSATPITMANMATLQTRASGLVHGESLTAQERSLLDSISVGNKTLGEGVAVRLAGFLAHHGSRPASGTHLGGKESVNCKLSEPDQVDFHIPLIPHLGDEECEGIVVEMIPQGREDHPSWTVENLRDIEETQRQVLFVGPLFYDNEHHVNADCASLVGSEPRRMSLWEIHPVIELYVCDPGQTCTATSKTGWKRVD